MTTKTNCRMIDKDELDKVALLAECSEVLLSDLLTDYFCNLKTANSNSPDYMACEFHRYRAYAHVCSDMAHRLTQELHKLGIYCFSD